MSAGAPQGGEPTSEVELSIECVGLRDMDTFSKSDPMCVAYTLEGGRWTRLGSTEIIWDNLNPKWAKKFDVRYYFEREQQFKFEVYGERLPLPTLYPLGSLSLSVLSLSRAPS